MKIFEKIDINKETLQKTFQTYQNKKDEIVKTFKQRKKSVYRKNVEGEDEIKIMNI